MLAFNYLDRDQSFYDGVDQGLERIQSLSANWPTIRFYGFSNIRPIAQKNEILQHNAVPGLFSEET